MARRKIIAGLAAGLILMGTYAAQAQDKVWNIVVAQPNVEHPYRVGGVERAKAWAAGRKDVNLTIIDGRRDSAVQLAGLEDALVRGADIVVMSPNDSDALAPIAATAKRANVPLVVFDRKLNVPDTEYAAFIGGDNVEMGRIAARYIVDKIGGKGVVIQMEGTPGASATTDRKTGFEEVMKQHPDIKVYSYVGHYRMHEAAAAMEDAAVAHPDVAAVFAHNDSMALGAGKVLAESGKTDLVIVGMDGGLEACQGLKEGKMTGSVHYPTMFPEALELAMNVLTDKPVQKVNLVETPMVTAENLADYCK
ncbi:substrate-binding domain-containing protein [Rhodoligotrophos defluvii]|uniref:substrate-binding domain-containing protein n=1 Tax=Rhodoligotrophos defluvii TaxID=2561934 RepID=UPI0010C93DDB|nr:substrate-binding domain-containing protein [Rhodoligotrophos defluvii]